MKKLYIFGDSFSLFDDTIKGFFSEKVEFNTHSSLSNDHILKLVKIKLLKLSKSDNNDGSNILIQLTVPSRICVLESSEIETKKTMISKYSYEKNMIKFGDSDVFDNKYYSLYPNFAATDFELIKMVFMPYLGFFINNNEKNILTDLILEISLLKKYATSIGINLEYFFYTSDFERVLSKELNSEHIRFGEYNTMHGYIKNSRPDYFVSSADVHFNDNGNKWYMKWINEKYDI
jgi:hypothetical protein